MANQLWCIDFLTAPTPLIIPHRLPALLESLMVTQKLILDTCKMARKQSEAFPAFLTLCRRSAKQTIPLSVLARNQTKGFGLEISAWPEVGKGTREGSWTKEHEEGSWRRTTDRAVNTEQQRNQSDEMRSRAVREDESRWVSTPHGL